MEGEKWLCPVCDLMHGHEVELVRTPGKRPEVRCPCGTCNNENRAWATEDEYLDWLRRMLPTIELEAAEKRKEDIYRLRDGEAETPEDVAHKNMIEELEDERRWEIRKAKGEGTYAPKSAWGGHTPPD